jgi:hypothetical protein
MFDTVANGCTKSPTTDEVFIKGTRIQYVIPNHLDTEMREKLDEAEIKYSFESLNPAENEAERVRYFQELERQARDWDK